MKKPNRMLILSCLLLTLLILACSGVFLLYRIGRPASYVWVMDAGEYKNQTYLVKMCPTGERLLQIQFGQSGQIGIDLTNNFIWASEIGDVDQINYDQIVQIDGEGKILNRFQGYASSIMAVDPNDSSVWVRAWNAVEQQAAMTKIASNGKLIRRVYGFSSPYVVALDARDGSLWVAEDNPSTITHLSKDGEKLSERNVSGYFFSNAPDQIAIESQSGDIWFTTTYPGTLHKMSAGGEVLFEISRFSSPIAVTIDPIQKNVWVADYDLGGPGALVKLDSAGQILLAQPLPDHAYAAKINPFDGLLWVGIDGGMLRYDDGKMVSRETGFHKPISIAFTNRRSNLLTELKCTLHFYANMLK